MKTPGVWTSFACLFSVFTLVQGFCKAPDFSSDAEINIAQALNPCCYGSQKCKNKLGLNAIGNFRLSDIKPDVILSCTGADSFHCTRCPSGLYFSEKCNACMEYLDDKHNACPKYESTSSPDVKPIPSNADADICKRHPYNSKHMGNIPDPKNQNFYYACVNEISYHMPCPGNLSYNGDIDRCI